MTVTNVRTAGINIDTEKKNPDFKFYAHHRNLWLNSLAITYILGGYGFSLFCITTDILWLNILGVFLLSHSLTWAAAFVHELFHDNIFSSRRLNTVFGEIFLFLTGSCYSRFRDLADHHMAHHIKRVDLSPFSPFSIQHFLRSLPRPILKLIAFLELLYIPAVNLIFRWMIALSPILGQNRRNERVVNISLLIIRGGLFTALAIYSFRALALYFIAYICFLNITQFLECFLHTFPAFQINGEIPKYSQKHEQANTYTIVISQHWRWLDLLAFCNHNYHNAHHQLMTCPWYLLSKMDAEMYPSDYSQYIPVSKLLVNYLHPSYRLRRLFSEDQGTVEKNENGISYKNFVGATGFSFMLLRTPFDFLKVSFSNHFNTI
ncbi:MAG: fatty acid desaturase [Xenococcaceae cyanobacterium MO_167.B27]|nr:fatty acid desaturase [Xenococcaceae cyanobacterium MO_167.B27]